MANLNACDEAYRHFNKLIDQAREEGAPEQTLQRLIDARELSATLSKQISDPYCGRGDFDSVPKTVPYPLSQASKKSLDDWRAEWEERQKKEVNE